MIRSRSSGGRLVRSNPQRNTKSTPRPRSMHAGGVVKSTPRLRSMHTGEAIKSTPRKFVGGGYCHGGDNAGDNFNCGWWCDANCCEESNPNSRHGSHRADCIAGKGQWKPLGSNM